MINFLNLLNGKEDHLWKEMIIYFQQQMILQPIVACPLTQIYHTVQLFNFTVSYSHS